MVTRRAFLRRGMSGAAIGGNVFFANQDNWALPAAENCLLDAETCAAQVPAVRM